MSFWATSDQQPIQSNGSYEVMTDLEPIPTGTLLRSIITEAKWDEYEGSSYISIRWDVIDGEYKGRVIFQKIRVEDADQKKRDKAIRMLAAIDSNAGGKLMASGERPTDIGMMQHLCNKPMLVRVRVWAIVTGDKKQGNWIDAVFNAAAAPANKPAQPAKKQEQPTFDDDVGF